MMAVETLLDSGAGTAALSEELLCAILNQAIANGLTPESEDWPLAGLEYWGSGTPGLPVEQAARGRAVRR